MDERTLPIMHNKQRTHRRQEPLADEDASPSELSSSEVSPSEVITGAMLESQVDLPGSGRAAGELAQDDDVSLGSKQLQLAIAKSLLYSHTPLPEQLAGQNKSGQTTDRRGHMNSVLPSCVG